MTADLLGMPAVFAFGFAAYAAASLSISQHRNLAGWATALLGASLIFHASQWPVVFLATLLWHLIGFVFWALRNPQAFEISRGPAAQLGAYLCGLRGAGWFLMAAASLVLANRFWDLPRGLPIFLVLSAVYACAGSMALLNAFNRKRQQREFWGDALQPDDPPWSPDQMNIQAAWVGLLVVAFLASCGRTLLPGELRVPVQFAVEAALLGTLALAIVLFRCEQPSVPGGPWSSSVYHDAADPRGRAADGRYNLANGLGWAYVVVDCVRYLLPGLVTIALLWQQ